MKNTPIVTLLLAFFAWSAVANAQIASPKCERECLRGTVTQLLYALVKHDVSSLPVADTLRVTEDAVEKPLAKIGLVGTVTRLRGFRQDIIDERAGIAGADVVVEETGAPVMLVVRVKVVADKLTEIELVATLSRADGLIFNIDGLSAPSAVMNDAPRPEQLAAREDCKFAPGCQNISTQSLAIFQRLGAHHRSKVFRRDRNPARSAEESWDR